MDEMTKRVIVVDLRLVNLCTATKYDSTLTNSHILILPMYYKKSGIDKALN